jgi:hypothetical protein
LFVLWREHSFRASAFLPRASEHSLTASEHSFSVSEHSFGASEHSFRSSAFIQVLQSNPSELENIGSEQMRIIF